MVTDIFGQQLQVGDIVIGTNESSFRSDKNRLGIILQLCNGNKAKVGQVNEEFYVDGSESSPIYSATMLVKFTDQAIANYGKENIYMAQQSAIAIGLSKTPEAKKIGRASCRERVS